MNHQLIKLLEEIIEEINQEELENDFEELNPEKDFSYEYR